MEDDSPWKLHRHYRGMTVDERRSADAHCSDPQQKMEMTNCHDDGLQPIFTLAANMAVGKKRLL
jgi:hypothetical protein